MDVSRAQYREKVCFKETGALSIAQVGLLELRQKHSTSTAVAVQQLTALGVLLSATQQTQ